MFRQTVVAIALLATPCVALSDAPDARTAIVVRDLGSDHFVAGSSVSVDKPVVGDLLVAGGQVEVRAPIGGDAVLAGGRLRLDSDVTQGVYAAGGQLTVSGRIGRNARIAGGQVEFASGSLVVGNTTVAAGEATLRGAAKGYVLVNGGRVLIDGAVDGDVIVNAGRLELGPNARIAGKLRYAARDELKRDPAAQVTGGLEKMDFPAGAMAKWRGERGFAGRGGWLWTIGMMLLAATLVGALPLPSRRVAQSVRGRFWLSLLLGFIALVCIPVATVLLLITVIGIPLALLTLLLYLTLLLIGYLASCIALADAALQRFSAARMESSAWRIAAAAFAVLAVSLLVRIPFVGGVVALVALLAGIGAVMLLFAARGVPAAPAPATL